MMGVCGGNAAERCVRKTASVSPGVVVNSETVGFERRAYQPYNLPAPEPTRFVNGVEFTNCFESDAVFGPV